MKRFFQLVGISLLTTLLVACGNDSKTDDSKLQVVTTFYPMYDFTKNIVGDNGEVALLIDGATEPHDYEPSAKDIAKIQDADVFVYNSKEMETWVPAVLESIDSKKTKVIEASSDIELMANEEEHDHEHGEEEHSHEVDPHVWLDPVLAQSEVKTITEGLADVKPELAASLKTNSENYIKELGELNNEFTNAFKDAKNKLFITQHAAFGYLAKRYDLEQKAIAGLSPDQEPNPSELGKIEDFVKENKVNIIYTEGLSSSKIAETIASSTGVELKDLSTLESISKKDRAAGEDYLSVMEDNLESLKAVIK